jgi:hypothetical protein
MLALAVACTTVAAVVAMHVAGAGAVTSRVIELGKTRKTPHPACPGTNCQAVGRVTGFQRQTGGTGGTKNPFISPVTGRIVAWSITTSHPADKERKFFNDLFGSPPAARIGVLSKIADRPIPKYKLLRQSPRQKLDAYLGEKTIFTLREPLYVKRGQIVALTIPTWVPALGVNLTSKNRWRASREQSKCNTSIIANNKVSHPQQKVGTTRRYSCDYTTSRLLYTAFIATKQ